MTAKLSMQLQVARKLVRFCFAIADREWTGGSCCCSYIKNAQNVYYSASKETGRMLPLQERLYEGYKKHVQSCLEVQDKANFQFPQVDEPCTWDFWRKCRGIKILLAIMLVYLLIFFST
nr:hypothetical protein Iba_chr11cCG9220 [Ipomoea batatas]